MKKKYYLGYCALMLSLCFVSCEEEFNDTEVPTLSISSPAADTKQWLDVTVSADVSDDQGVSRVEFYLDDDLLGEATAAPYELSFDSKAYEDGTYLLKTIAFDDAGNQTEAEQSIEIFNTLLKVNVEEDALSATDERWIVVGGIDGEVIESVMLENGGSYTIARPDDYLEEKINVIELRVNTYDFGEYIYVDQMNNLSPEEWKYIAYESQNTNTDSIGLARISFNYSSLKSSTIQTHNISSIYSLSSDNGDGTSSKTYRLSISKEPASSFIYLYNMTDDEAPKYNWMTGLKSNDEYFITDDDFTSMSLLDNISLPENNYVSFYLTSINSEEEQYRAFDMYSYDGITSLPVYAPLDLFEDYKYSITFENGDYRYYKSAMGIPDASYSYPQINFEVLDNSLESFSTQVDFDGSFIENAWYYNNNSKSVYWYLCDEIKDGKIEAKKMTLPAEIMNKYALLSESNGNLEYSRSSFYYIENISSLDEYAKEIYHERNSIPEYEYLNIYSDDTNARTAQDKMIRDPFHEAHMDEPYLER